MGLGTIYIKKLQIENRNLFLNLFYQFAFAGIIQLAFAFSSAKTIDVSTWSLESIAAILYLAIFGSVVAFFSYHYLLKTLLPTQVSMLSYVNTVISIVLSWLILNETISAKFIIAAVFIISGVFIINYKPGILKKTHEKKRNLRSETYCLESFLQKNRTYGLNVYICEAIYLTLKLLTMKKIFVIASTAALLLTSCKKEEQTVVTDQDNDTVAVVTTETTPLTEVEAKAKVDQAQADLDAAIKKGDKDAETAARKALADANTAWESTKSAVDKTAKDVKQDVDSTAEKAKQDMKDAAKDTKTAVDKAAQDTKEATKKAAEDAKNAYNNALDKAKAK